MVFDVVAAEIFLKLCISNDWLFSKRANKAIDRVNIVYYYNDLWTGREKHEFFFSRKPRKQAQQFKFDDIFRHNAQNPSPLANQEGNAKGLIVYIPLQKVIHFFLDSAQTEEHLRLMSKYRREKKLNWQWWPQ